ncbi:hypothetical protein [Rubellimicrobium arenae]|uniref:hypothetical protein n=1 Tax=Rubellimicrobium arenae TaxID=2817372 RepID=UPI001B3025F4|nr:hypothetical protein [Rubellimicrobium arenae]
MTIRPIQLLLGLLLAGLGWIAVLALVLRLGGPAPAVLVVLPPPGFLQEVPPDVTITDRNALGLVARGSRNLVAELYRAGAPLVLPAGLAGCLGLAS